jgi:hypothetical protein
MIVKVASPPKLDEKVVESVVQVALEVQALSERGEDPATKVMR